MPFAIVRLVTDPCVVLVVDDNRHDSQLVHDALEFVAFTGVVVVVDNAPQAFAYLSRRAPYAKSPPPHLVVLDLGMPAIDGFTVLREMKAHPEWAAIPVFIFSASDIPGDESRAVRMGANRYLPKPLDWKGYVEVARQVMQSC